MRVPLHRSLVRPTLYGGVPRLPAVLLWMVTVLLGLWGMAFGSLLWVLLAAAVAAVAHWLMALASRDDPHTMTFYLRQLRYQPHYFSALPHRAGRAPKFRRFNGE